MSSSQVNTSRRRQFDLWALLEWTAVVAFLIALLAGAGGESNWAFGFTQFPADDSALRNWLNRNGYADVQIARKENSIELIRRRSGWTAWKMSVLLTFPQPPWEKLGYSLPTSIHGRSNWRTFSGSIYLWIVGFAILSLLAVARRRMARRHQELSTTS